MPQLLPLLITTLLLTLSTSATVPCPTGSSLIPNCATCSTSGSTTICSSCINGYYLLSAQCIACNLALANCQFCTLNVASQLSCSVCQDNYGLLNNTCQLCSAISGCTNCSIVSNQLRCTQCQGGLVYYSVQNSCVPCQITNCTVCAVDSTGAFTCSVCSLGYYLSNNTCLPCAATITYCSSCLFDQNNRLVCAACASSKMYVGNNQCMVNCSLSGQPTCSVCQLTALTNGITTCSSCISGYYLNPTAKTCESCTTSTPGCQNCTLNTLTNSTSCLSCQPGYYISANACIACSTININCQLCMVSTGAVCTGCKAGFYLNGTDKGCYSCSSSPFVNASFAVNSCSVCELGTNGLLICTQCMSTHYFSGGICLSCSSTLANCNTCNSSGTCLTCTIGYLLNSTTSTCQLCSSSFPFCLYCNQIECTDCQTGYYTTNNKVCVANCLVVNCATCQAMNNQVCATCKQGYSVQNGQCSITACAGGLTFNGRSCGCQIQSYLSNGQCLPCTAANCLYCPNNTCSECLRGYFLNGTACTACPSRCHLCVKNGECLLCNDGYYFSGGACVLVPEKVVTLAGIYKFGNLDAICGQGCASCGSTSLCVACVRGYYLNNSTCLQCPLNCLACNLTNSTNTSTLTCLYCSSGTALLSNICQPCADPNCISCDFNQQFCMQCRVSFSRNSTGWCMPCAGNCDFCDLSGPGTCDALSCSVGYTRFNVSVCLPCLEGCPSCNPVFPFTCIGCLIGTYKDSSSGKCLNCPQGCFNCSSPSNCTACLSYYYLSQNQCLKYCNLPCLNCTYDANSTMICSKCLRGYDLVNGTCSASLACSTQSICQFCPLGYFPYKGTCHSCPSFCAQCTFTPPDPTFTISGSNHLSYTVCTLCHTGYHLAPATKTCALCSSFCLLCSNGKDCLVCAAGYFLEKRYYNYGLESQYSIGICLICRGNCLRCELSGNRCVGCREGYNLVGFKCVAKVVVNFGVTLAVGTSSTISKVTADFQGILTALYITFGQPYTSDPTLVTLSSLTLGSLVISGSVDATSNPSAVYSTLSTNLQNTPTLSGYSMTSHTVQAQGFTPQGDSSSSNIILVVAIIGGLVGLIIIVVVVCCLVKRRRAKQEEEEREETQTGTEPAATLKNMLKNNMTTERQSEFDPNNNNNPAPTPYSHREHSKPPKRQVSHISDIHSQHDHPNDVSRQTKPRAKQSTNMNVKKVSYREDVVYDERQPKSGKYSKEYRGERERSRHPGELPERSRYREEKPSRSMVPEDTNGRSEYRPSEVPQKRRYDREDEEEYSRSQRPSHRPGQHTPTQLDRTVEKSRAANRIDYGSEQSDSIPYESTSHRPPSHSRQPYLANDSHFSRPPAEQPNSNNNKGSNSVDRKAHKPNKNTYYI